LNLNAPAGAASNRRQSRTTRSHRCERRNRGVWKWEDGAVTSRTGTREGPRSLRIASANWAYREGAEPYWDGEIGVPLLGGVRFVDTGDVELAAAAPAETGLVGKVTQYGIRGLHTAADNIALARERGVVTHWCEPVRRELSHGRVEGLVEHIAPDDEVWITFDIDVLDPAIAPGSGTPEPGGLSYYEAKAMLVAVASRADVIGMDLVELNPLYDPGQLAALHGARLILDTVGAVFERRRRAG
jgi:arginase family enzyme